MTRRRAHLHLRDDGRLGIRAHRRSPVPGRAAATTASASDSSAPPPSRCGPRRVAGHPRRDPRRHRPGRDRHARPAWRQHLGRRTRRRPRPRPDAHRRRRPVARICGATRRWPGPGCSPTTPTSSIPDPGEGVPRLLPGAARSRSVAADDPIVTAIGAAPGVQLEVFLALGLDDQAGVDAWYAAFGRPRRPLIPRSGPAVSAVGQWGGIRPCWVRRRRAARVRARIETGQSQRQAHRTQA